MVDFWGGTADAKTGRRWQAAYTIACLNSPTKGVTALCALLLAQDGLVDLDAPIAEVWPEFAAKARTASPFGWCRPTERTGPHRWTRP